MKSAGNVSIYTFILCTCHLAQICTMPNCYIHILINVEIQQPNHQISAHNVIIVERALISNRALYRGVKFYYTGYFQDNSLILFQWLSAYHSARMGFYRICFHEQHV